MAKLVFSSTRLFQDIFIKQRLSHSLVKFVGSATTAPNSKDATDIATYVRRDDEFRFAKYLTIQRLEKLLGITQYHAIEITSQHKQLCEVTGYMLSENYKICEKNGLRHKTIIKCVDILGIRDLEDRIKVLKDLQSDLNDVAPLLRLTPRVLRNILNRFAEHGNSLNYLTKTLKVSKFYLAEQYVKKPFLQRLPKERIQAVVELLFSYGVSGNDIANDLVSLNYTVSTIEERISFAKEHNVEEIKTWMIRVDLTIFDNYLKIRSEHKSILGDKSVAEYLSERLDCSLQMAEYLVLKQPALSNKSVKKIEEIIDYILDHGYLPSHICRVPKIMLHSFETIKKRMKQLQEKNIKPESLYVLIKSPSKFDHYVSMFEKSRSKRLQNT